MPGSAHSSGKYQSRCRRTPRTEPWYTSRRTVTCFQSPTFVLRSRHSKLRVLSEVENTLDSLHLPLARKI